MNTTDVEIQKILSDYSKIAVIGLSADVTKPSHKVPLFMKSVGYDVVGVNPTQSNISGMAVFKSLKEVPAEHRKFIDIFRRPEHIPAIVDEIIELGGTEVVWLQLGITHAEAERKAEAAGLKVVSDRCLYIEYMKRKK